ncbi:MAG: hypothetical protein P8L18_06740 [Verrucomicrobiota bacterium]|nr:hypothetical protein [Verrucomicrobiota bacterium]
MTAKSIKPDIVNGSKMPQWVFLACLVLGLIVMPLLYALGVISIETVNMFGRYLTFAIIAIGLDLLWGYTGVLSLCQATFFCLGAYCMGIYLAHHGGPEGITDRVGWKIPACLYVVYPYDIGEVPEDAVVPWFWKPFFNLPLTLMLGMLIPGMVAMMIGFFGFRSRVRGVYFAILTQAIAVAAFLFFQRNEVKFGGTNGLTRFEQIGSFRSITEFGPRSMVENGSFQRGADGWLIEGEGGPVLGKGYVLESTAQLKLSCQLAKPIVAGKSYTSLFDLSETELDGFAFTVNTLTEDGLVAESFVPRTIDLREKHASEFRIKFTASKDAERFEISGQTPSDKVFSISNIRLFERYVSRSEGFQLSDNKVQMLLYMLTVLALAAVYQSFRSITRSKFGRVLVAIRDDETSLRFLGYPPWVYKMVTFSMAGAVAGLAGMLYVPQMRIITPYDMEAARSILVVIWVALGGRGTLSGAILGALSANLLYDYFTSEHDYGLFTWKAEYWQFILGALFIGVVLIFPRGLIQFLPSWESEKRTTESRKDE